MQECDFCNFLSGKLGKLGRNNFQTFAKVLHWTLRSFLAFRKLNSASPSVGQNAPWMRTQNWGQSWRKSVSNQQQPSGRPVSRRQRRKKKKTLLLSTVSQQQQQQRIYLVRTEPTRAGGGIFFIRRRRSRFEERKNERESGGDSGQLSGEWPSFWEVKCGSAPRWWLLKWVKCTLLVGD